MNNPVIIPYGHQWVKEEDIQSVVDVLKGDWLTQGPKIKEFEKKLAEYCGAKYAVAVSSGTAALHCATLVAGIKEADEVVTTPITFVASANCILYCNSRTVFADVLEDTANIDPAEIEKKVTVKTKGIIPVHFAGQPCDLVKIYQIARKNNLVVIEDACHALGARYKVEGEPNWIKVGSCAHSDMTVFSFHPVKHITTGEGGAVLTNNEDLYEKMQLFRTHGITKNQMQLRDNHGPWYYEMQELGYNYRITDFQCALGIKQLERLDEFVARRREIADRYRDAFNDMKEITIPCNTSNAHSSYHLYVIQLNLKRLITGRRQIFDVLRQKGLGVQVHYIPVHLQPYYQQRFGYKEGDFPVAERFYEQAITLPLFPKMNDEEVGRVIKIIRDTINTYRN